MFFVSGLRCPKVLVSSILAVAVGMFSGCVSTPESHQHSAHNQAVATAAAADFELDGYYESLPSLGKMVSNPGNYNLTYDEALTVHRGVAITTISSMALSALIIFLPF